MKQIIQFFDDYAPPVWQVWLCLIILSLSVASACKSPEQVPATAAESAYTTELLRCVDQAHTLAESKACRAQVNVRWGIVEVEAGAK